MCAWRGRRGSTAELDFSDSEFCSSFFLRPPFPFRALSTTLSVSIPPSPSHHRFTLSRRYRRRAPRFPWRTIHSSAPVLFSATTTITITTTTPTTTIVLLYLYIRMVSFFLLYCSTVLSLDLHLVLWLRRVARGPGDQTGGAADTIKRGKSDGQRIRGRTCTGRERVRRSRRPCDRVLGYPLGRTDEERKRNRAGRRF